MLPAEFADLEPFADKWCLATERERYATRYVPGETRYLEEVDPESIADVVVENTDFERPRLVVRGHGPGPGATRPERPRPGV